jgi:hypothetical protein
MGWTAVLSALQESGCDGWDVESGLVRRYITKEALVTREQVQRQTIGDLLDEITASSERILENDSFESVRGERMAG